MVATCWVPGCTNRLKKGGDAKFFRFPRSKPARLTKWLVSIGRMCGPGQERTRTDGFLQPKEHSRICSAHFVSGTPSRDPLSIDYVPSVFFDYQPRVKELEDSRKRKLSQCDCQKTQYPKSQKLEPIQTSMSLAEMPLAKNAGEVEIKSESSSETGVHWQTTTATLLSLAKVVGADNSWDVEIKSESYSETGVHCQTEEIKCVDACTQTDDNSCRPTFIGADTAGEDNSVANTSCDKFIELDKAYEYLSVLSEETEKLKMKINDFKYQLRDCQKERMELRRTVYRFDHSLIENSDERTSYFTGFPNYTTFLFVFKKCLKNITIKPSKLSPIEEFFICLIKLRHDYGMEDLGYRYKISHGTICHIFHEWLESLFITLPALNGRPPDTDLSQASIHDQRLSGRTKAFRILKESALLSFHQKEERVLPTTEKIWTVVSAIINLWSPLMSNPVRESDDLVSYSMF